MDAIKNIKDYAELFSLCKWMKAFFLLNTQDSGYHQTFLKMLEGREIEEWKTVGVFPQVASEGPDFWLTNLRHGQDHPSQFLFLSVQLGLVEEDSWKMLTSCQPTLQSYFLLQKAAKHPANCSIHLLSFLQPLFIWGSSSSNSDLSWHDQRGTSHLKTKQNTTTTKRTNTETAITWGLIHC